MFLDLFKSKYIAALSSALFACSIFASGQVGAKYKTVL